MASNIMVTNGVSGSKPSMNDIKIMVVGEEKCGKSEFIKTFSRRLGNTNGKEDTDYYAKVYPCTYEINGDARNIKIYEILSGPENFVKFFIEIHKDSNAIVFVYAVDDPESFRAIGSKWLPVINNIERFTKQAVLVGNKKDLRSDPQVIERLAMVGQAPVTIEQGESFANQSHNILMAYYDCSSIDENDRGIHDAFHFLVESGLLNWTENQMPNP